MLRPWTLLWLLLLAVPLGCRGTGGPSAPAAPARTIGGVDPRYQPQLEAMRAAVEEQDDQVARRISSSLRARLRADAARGLAETGPALELLEGFERILMGRLLVGALELELVDRPLEGGLAVLVLLRARSQRPVVLRPLGAQLRVHRMTLSPEGKESRAVRTVGRVDLGALELGEEWLEVPLESFATTIPSNALGARTHWTLELLAGDVLEQDQAYPAQRVQVAGAERVDLAPFLPNQPVEPEELVAYAQRDDLAAPPLLERTVRIAPERREEALDLLTGPVESMSAEQIARLVPTLRWLSRTGLPGQDPLAWRTWLRRRAEVRAESRWP